MSTHPIVPLDMAEAEDVAARLDLRRPNAEALEHIAKQFDSANGQRFEVVLDLATGVGKTYIAAATIDYLAASGIRNFMIVVPGNTIHNKTVANLTPGHPKSVLGGMNFTPVVVTAEDFARGTVRAALDDTNTVKVFVFKVQQLTKPTENSTRRTRKYQESIGRSLYEHLEGLDDLVILADEHHVYEESKTAKAFSKAIRDLDPLALIGLTATPAKSSLSKVIYQYPLARAIADGFVKTPVLVGRRDDRTDIETQLRDGLALLDAKRTAVNAWAAATGADPVNPVMFVVTKDIDNANAVADTLQRLLDDYDGAVLTVTSQSPDDALARLDAVEAPDSPVRVIVSVDMLKEGWDVKNIYVICSFRPSISDALTEQTLGRGLRLPWGERTDIELLDTVEVLSHERYEQLLERAGTLIEGLVADRAYTGIPDPGSSTAETPAAGSDDSATTGTAPPAPGSQGAPPATGASSTTGTPQTTPGGTSTDGPDGSSSSSADDSGTDGSATSTGGFGIGSVEDRTAAANAEAAALTQVIQPRDGIRLKLPKLTRVPHPKDFKLSDLDEAPFRELGKQLKETPANNALQRTKLEIVDDHTSPSGIKLVPTKTTDIVDASIPNLPLVQARQGLVDAILSSELVKTSKANINAAARLADAVIDAAGGDEANLAWYYNTAAEAVRSLVARAYKVLPTTYDDSVDVVEFAPSRPGRTEEKNRYGKFSKQVGYTGWKRSLMPLEWFDSDTERKFANLVDDDEAVDLWIRFHRGDFEIRHQTGTYHPDFYVRLVDGSHWLIEVKADRDLNTKDVQDKKVAAEKLARLLTDLGNLGTWKYLLLSQSAVEAAKGNWNVLVARATA